MYLPVISFSKAILKWALTMWMETLIRRDRRLALQQKQNYHFFQNTDSSLLGRIKNVWTDLDLTPDFQRFAKQKHFLIAELKGGTVFKVQNWIRKKIGFVAQDNVAEPEPVGAGTFWSEPESVWRFEDKKTF